MPNFQAKNLNMPKFPVKFGNSEFIFCAVSKRDEKLIKTRYADEEFFIQIKNRENTLLVKGDKITRPSQVVFLQRALQDFQKLTDAKTLFSNIEFKKEKSSKKYRVVKNIDFFADEFQTDKEIWVEVGFGSGRHLLHQAKEHKDILFIGLEIHKPSLEQVAKQCELQKIDNIFLIDYDARIFLEFLNSNSVGKIFVHFPIPWDKKPHRRVISKEFIDESLRVLKRGGRLEVRTDSSKYFRFCFEEFISLSRTDLVIKKNQDTVISSKYEDRWKKQKKDIFDLFLINDEVSKEKDKIGKLELEGSFDFSKIYANFKEVTVKRRDSFLHVEDIFSINDKEGLIKVSFGSSMKNERAYLICLEDKIGYFPDNILASKANLSANSLIQEWLNEICS